MLFIDNVRTLDRLEIYKIKFFHAYLLKIINDKNMKKSLKLVIQPKVLENV